MEKKPDKPEDVTNKPLPSMSEPMEVQDAVAFTLATPFAQPIIAASKSKAMSKAQNHSISIFLRRCHVQLSSVNRLYRQPSFFRLELTMEIYANCLFL
ncbi:hypothetical protein Zmor_020887 [Zophobas morio]|uniref:Uncharacterized protein n=1 Tax=Zophobas morio TaxID=2755281 RepID=A0AA38I4U0_9CUCU|nr:hypothetical protein Zmor_020887 [Zophobas morio]